MKSVLPILTLGILLASCSTAYKTGQTPDDVYYSPERPQEEYVRVDKDNDRQYRSNASNRRYNDRYDEDYYDDRYLRMRVRNRRLWSDLDFYYSDPFAYNYYNYYNRYNHFYYNDFYWNPYTSWNYFYNPYSYYNPYYGYRNPYGSHVIIVNPQSRQVYNRPRTSNLHVFDNPASNANQNANRGSYNNGRGRVFCNSNNNTYIDPSGSSSPRRSNTGNDLRSIFGNNSSSNNHPSNSGNSPSRTFDNSSSNSSRSSGSESSGSSNSSNNSGGGRAPSRRF